MRGGEGPARHQVVVQNLHPTSDMVLGDGKISISMRFRQLQSDSDSLHVDHRVLEHSQRKPNENMICEITGD